VQRGREVDEIVFGDALPVERGRLARNGWVGEYHSPGTSPFATGRSSIGHTGVPLVRSNV